MGGNSAGPAGQPAVKREPAAGLHQVHVHVRASELDHQLQEVSQDQHGFLPHEVTKRWTPACGRPGNYIIIFLFFKRHSFEEPFDFQASKFLFLFGAKTGNYLCCHKASWFEPFPYCSFGAIIVETPRMGKPGKKWIITFGKYICYSPML